MPAPTPPSKRTRAARLAAGALLITMYGFSHGAAAFGAAQATSRDRDGDGMPNRWEVANGLNPDRPNAGGDKDHDGLRNLGEFRHHSDPTDTDTDTDGVDDGDEVHGSHTDPADADTDDDGLDGDEVHDTGTDPTDVDSDDDGTPDGNEDSDDDGIDNEDEDDADEVCTEAPALSEGSGADDTDVDECTEDDDDVEDPADA